MKTYAAVHRTQAHTGCFTDCLMWARARVAADPVTAVIAALRPGEKLARVVFEVARDSERSIRYGTTIPARKFRP